MKKKVILGLSAALLACTCTGALAACAQKAETLPEFTYDYSTPVEDFGDGISIDGKPDEALWENQRALEADIRNTTATYKATAYFGEGGVYFAFWVQDDAVYYNADREIWANSGVEFCVGSPQDTSITYEIDLNAGGKRMLRKYTGAPYTNWFSELHSAVWTDGEVNTAECKGYTAEIYLPYHLFNADGSDTPVDELLLNFAIIRANSADATNTDRLWYSIGEQERGLGWAPASQNWYHFNKNGLVANDVTLTAGEHGALEGRDWTISGDEYTFSILPDEGYCLDTLVVNGQNVADNITYSDRVARYSFTATGDVEVSATFAPLPSQTYTLSGSIATEDDASVEKVSVYAVTRGAVAEIPVENGTYSAQLPESDYQLYAELDGYLTAIYDVSLYGNREQNITLRTMFLGNNVIIGSGSNASSWDLSMLGQGTAISLDSGWLVTANHTTIYDTKAFVSANIVLPMSPGAGRRAGFRFVDAGQNGIYVCLYANNENGADSYEVQLIRLVNGASTTWHGGYVFSDEVIRALANSTGVPLSVLYENGTITVWANGVPIIQNWSLIDNGFGITAETQVVPGLTTAGYGDFYHVEFNTVGYEEGYPVTITTEGRGSVTADKSVYQANDTIIFTLQPQDGYEVTSLTVNGRDYISSISDGKLVFDAGSLASVNVSVTFERVEGEDGTLSGTAMAAGVPVADAQVVIYNSSGDRYTTTTNADGEYSFTQTLSAGTWYIQITASGYLDYEGVFTVDGSTTWNAEMTATSMADKYIAGGDRDAFDLESIESEGLVTYVGTGGEGHIMLNIAADGNKDFWLESVMRNQDTFVPDNAGLRMGYTIYFNANTQVQFTIGRWVGDAENAWRFMLNNWGDIDATNPFTDAQNAAFNGDGLRIAAARINGTLYLFAEENGAMVPVLSVRTEATANASANLGFGTWYQAANAEYREVSWKIGNIALEVTQSAEGGTVSAGSPSLGDSLVITLTPEGHNVLSSVTVNGMEYIDYAIENADGTYTLTINDWVNSTKVEIEAVFRVVESETGTLSGKVTSDGEAVSGIEVVITNAAGACYTATSGADGVYTFADAIASGSWTISVNAEGYHPYQGVLILDGATQYDIALRIITLEDKWVISGGGDYDISGIESGTVVYTGTSGEGHLRLNVHFGENENVWIEARLHVTDAFITDDAGGIRLGFTLWFGEQQVHFTILKPLGGTWGTAINNWGDINATGWYFSDAMVEALESEAGLRIGVGRFGGSIGMYAEDDGEMVCIAATGSASTATAAVDVGLATWFQAVGAVYTDLNFEFPELNITKSGTNGTVDVEGSRMGDNLVVTLTPETGYVLDTLLVNGADQTANCVRNYETGVYTFTQNTYGNGTAFTVSATFRQLEEYTVSMTLQLHRYGVGENNLTAIPDGLDVTLTNQNGRYTAKSEQGKAEFSFVLEGTYELAVEGYKAYTVEVAGDVQASATLEYVLIGSGQAVDTTQVNDGIVNINFEVNNDRVLFTREVAANEDFFVAAYFTNIDIDAEAIRFGFFAGVDVNGDGEINPFAADSAAEAATLNVVYQWYSGNREFILQNPSNWNGYFFQRAQAEQLATDTGLRIGLARVNGVFYYLMEVGGKFQIVMTVNSNTSNIANAAIRVGIMADHYSGNTAPKTGAILKDLTFEVVTKGTAFADADVAAIFTPAASGISALAAQAEYAVAMQPKSY